MDPAFLVRGALAGVVATFTMLVVEVPMVRRFGFRGVFEWHEIQMSLARWTHQTRARAQAVLLLHLLAGAVAGLLFAIALSVHDFGLTLLVQGLALGVLLWLVTLIIHETITDVHPWRNDMGLGPVAASLVGHLAYGASLGFLLEWP